MNILKDTSLESNPYLKINFEGKLRKIFILYWGKKELRPNWEWEEMALKNREGDTGRGGI